MLGDDVLVKWDWEIAAAEAAYLHEGGRPDSAMQCIRELAEAVRVARKQVAELEPDAALGRVVDRIPVGGCLRRSKIYQNPHWRVEPFDCHDLTRIGWSQTPITALERENAALRGGL
jgi:hypothetical protein